VALDFDMAAEISLTINKLPHVSTILMAVLEGMKKSSGAAPEPFAPEHHAGDGAAVYKNGQYIGTYGGEEKDSTVYW
jgi:hypothetical protein